MSWLKLAVLKRLVAAGALSCGLAAATTGFASPARTAWSTYLRAGPGDAYTVIDEVQHGSAVDLGPCNDRWCQVRMGGAIGYIDKDAVTLPGPQSGSPPASAQSCFTTGQVSYRGSSPTRFCETQPAKASTVH